MVEFFRHLFSNDFMPHGMCYLWNPAVLWLNVISDYVIAAAYYAIPFLLFYFVKRRRDLAFNWIFVAFGMFILACGSTHLMAGITVWNPLYRLDGVIKAVTALASVTTFVMLIPMMPTLISVPSPSELARVNKVLAKEIEDRRQAEAEVRKMNEELENRVLLRTAERRNLEEQLIQSQKMEAIGRLAGGVAHDFNNLLTVILGYNDMLREQVKEDPVAVEYNEEVFRASQRASALTNQLLAFSRRQVAVPRVVDLNLLVQQIDKMLRRIIGEDIQPAVKLDPALRPVKVDPSHMDQVIMNIAVNARDAMPAGGKLTVETSNVQLTEEYAGQHIGLGPGAYVLLAISDTGTGMDAATKSRIFEPFFTTKEKGKGTGLGLAIVYGIVKQNGGDILVYSELGHGTVFKIYLPAVREQAETIRPESEEDETTPATETILLVEDEEQVRGLTRTMLARRGYRVLDAASAAGALELLRTHSDHIDLLITDIVMPQTSGLELAKAARTMRPDIKVLYMSGYTDIGVVDSGTLTADTPFIAKPFTSRGLNAKIREVLRA
jgi:signal transduction histidine kinase/CheY-like chemotaxis protein